MMSLTALLVFWGVFIIIIYDPVNPTGSWKFSRVSGQGLWPVQPRRAVLNPSVELRANISKANLTETSSTSAPPWTFLQETAIIPPNMCIK